MIDFTTLQGLTIPEGVVTQITDESGRVIWAVMTDKPIVLKVEKITSNTYAGETSYTSEQFILLDIYPKTNGTVKVTYGGLTKTIKDTSGAASPNAQQVFFGTFNGVTDSVATPASGELTIEGDCYAFGVGMYNQSSKLSVHCGCVTTIKSFGDVTKIPASAFVNCKKITSVKIPNSVTEIGFDGFNTCTSLTSVKLSTALKTIGHNAFAQTSIESVEIPKSVTSIGYGAFACVTSVDSKAVYHLKNVTMLSETPPELIITTSDSGSYYGNFGDLRAENKVLEKIIVPKGSGDTYKTTEGWSTYADYIVEAS